MDEQERICRKAIDKVHHRLPGTFASAQVRELVMDSCHKCLDQGGGIGINDLLSPTTLLARVLYRSKPVASLF